MFWGVGKLILSCTSGNHLCNFVTFIEPVENLRFSIKLNFKTRGKLLKTETDYFFKVHNQIQQTIMGLCQSASHKNKDSSTAETHLNSLGTDLGDFPNLFGGSGMTGTVQIQHYDTGYYIGTSTSVPAELKASVPETDPPTWTIGVTNISSQTFVISTSNSSGKWYCWAMDAALEENNNVTPPTVSVNYTASCNGEVSSNDNSLSNNNKWQFRSVMGSETPTGFASYFKIKNVGRGRYLKCDGEGPLSTAGGFGNGSGQYYSFFFCFTFLWCFVFFILDFFVFGFFVFVFFFWCTCFVLFCFVLFCFVCEKNEH